jgi:lincosamide and streptogramin A transport system ATP-binding/permease protein
VSTIICRGLSFGYDGSEADIFTRLDLTIDTRWRTALLGRNGRGKTTLLKLLAGTLSPDAGQIEASVPRRLFTGQPDRPGLTAWQAARNAAGPYSRWEAELDRLAAAGDEPSLERFGELETLYRERGGYQVDAGLERELALLDVDPDLRQRPFESLSGGEQTRCLLAGLFCGGFGFPLIDEPTNHLDLEGRRRVGAYLAGKSGFVLVSHDRAFLDDCIDHVIALNPDTVETHRTTFSTWRAQYRARLDEQARANAALRKDIRRLEATAGARRAGALAREADKAPHVDKGFVGARAARQMKRAIAAERRAEQAAESRRESLVDVEKAHPPKLPPLPDGIAASTVLVAATNLSIVRGGELFRPVTFSVTAGDRLAILGPNGCGKTSLLELILGASVDHVGEIVRPRHVCMSTASQIPRWCNGRLSDRLAVEGFDESRFRQIMAALGVRGALLEQPLDRLSQGQLKKIELARSLIEPVHLMIWDEPLNYVDVDTREILEALIAEPGARRPALICVEHDARFVETVATSVIELQPRGRRSGEGSAAAQPKGSQ